MGLEGLGKLKKSYDVIGNQTRDLPACSIVPQPTALPRAPFRNSNIKRGNGVPQSVICNGHSTPFIILRNTFCPPK
jgi:hypothetical protein